MKWGMPGKSVVPRDSCCRWLPILACVQHSSQNRKARENYTRRPESIVRGEPKLSWNPNPKATTCIWKETRPSGVIKTLHIQGRGVPSSPMQFCITSSLSSANLFDAAITDTYLTKVLAQPLIVSQDYLYIINLFFFLILPQLIDKKKITINV